MLGVACKEPGCPAVIKDTERYCEKHKREPRNKPFASVVRDRNPLYSTAAWLCLRKAKLATHPLCELCKEALANEVHHVIPAKDHPERALDWSNLQSLCAKCHKGETSKEVKRK